MVPVFKNVGERSTAKNYHPVSLLAVVSKVFEKLVNNRIVDHLEKFGLFSDFSMVLGLLDQLTVVSDRIARTFNRLGLLKLGNFIYPKLLTGCGMLVFFTNLSHEILGQMLGLISSFLSNKQRRVVLDGESSQEYSVNAGVPQGSILGPTLFLLYINDLPDDVICNITMLMILLFILSEIRLLICGNNLNWLLNLNLIYKTCGLG